jgi:hypothetical protein
MHDLNRHAPQQAVSFTAVLSVDGPTVRPLLSAVAPHTLAVLAMNGGASVPRISPVVTNRLVEFKPSIGDDDFHLAKLAMQVRFPPPAPRSHQLERPSVQLSTALAPLPCLTSRFTMTSAWLP